MAAADTSICLRLQRPPEDVYSYTEVNHVLGEVVDRNGTLGLVQALLALGGDVNFTRRRSIRLWDKIVRKDQQEERSALLRTATRRSRAELVHALADYADQTTLDGALHDAIQRSDLAVLRALMIHGADPGELHDDFEGLVTRSQLPIIQLLLGGPRLPCLSCRSTGLRIAVKNNAKEVLLILLKSGADVNHESGIALTTAADVSRPDFVALLISGPVPASPMSLDLAAGRAYEGMKGHDDEKGRAIVDMCLTAGGAGPETNRMLTQGIADSIRDMQLQLLDTLLKFANPSGKYEAAALLEAIRSERKDVLAKLLGFGPSPRTSPWQSCRH